MKVSKKLLSMVLCGCITFGGVQALSLKKVDAFQEPIKWSVPIRIKLRAVNNYFYKQWRQINLDCTKDNILQLRKTSTIPNNMTFDDNFVIGDSGFKNIPQLIIICEDDKHIAETFKEIVVNKLEIDKIKLYFTTDLRQNEESLDKTLVGFKVDEKTGKYKMDSVQVKLLGM